MCGLGPAYHFVFYTIVRCFDSQQVTTWKNKKTEEEEKEEEKSENRQVEQHFHVQVHSQPLRFVFKCSYIYLTDYIGTTHTHNSSKQHNHLIFSTQNVY